MGDEGGLVVLPLPEKQEVKVLNEVGMRVFEMLDGSRSERQIAEQIASEFDVSPEAAASDVRAFLDELGRNGMLAAGRDEAAASGERN
jgi:hypothetical protein